MMQGLNYIRRWDYDISDTRLSEKNRPIGRWGRMYRDYIKEHNLIIKQMKAAEMFREHESTLFLLIYSVNFSWHPRAKFQIFYLSDQIVN